MFGIPVVLLTLDNRAAVASMGAIHPGAPLRCTPGY
jgi:hypothetical protein